MGTVKYLNGLSTAFSSQSVAMNIRLIGISLVKREFASEPTFFAFSNRGNLIVNAD
jgi:hypothetical protein